jgi:hypothetical protein
MLFPDETEDLKAASALFSRWIRRRRQAPPRW